jgi:membrane protease YdiL (CAAX protease family)
MPALTSDPMSLIPFAFLLLAVLGLWIHRWLWSAALAASIVAAYVTGALYGLAVVWIAVLAALALLYRHVRSRASTPLMKLAQVAAGLALFIFALALALLLLPGFPRTTLTEATVLSPGAMPYGIGLGFPKVVAGILILGIINEERVSSWSELSGVLSRTAPVFLATLVAVIACAWSLGYVRLDPKWTTLFLVWAPVNLFFTCLSEEAFFRGFVQRELARIGKGPVAAVVAIGVAAILFGLVHFGGGWKYVAAGIVAGAGYGWAYHRTQRIESAMAVHFGVNAVHFLLFTYPGLAGA